MTSPDEREFDTALKKAGLKPDAHDKAAALKVFRYLQDAKAGLAREERNTDERN